MLPMDVQKEEPWVSRSTLGISTASSLPGSGWTVVPHTYLYGQVPRPYKRRSPIIRLSLVPAVLVRDSRRRSRLEPHRRSRRGGRARRPRCGRSRVPEELPGGRPAISGSMSRAPRLLTPPPMTITSGSITLAAPARTRPTMDLVYSNPTAAVKTLTKTQPPSRVGRLTRSGIGTAQLGCGMSTTAWEAQ